jgi:hypothetical protein
LLVVAVVAPVMLLVVVLVVFAQMLLVKLLAAVEQLNLRLKQQLASHILSP